MACVDRGLGVPGLRDTAPRGSGRLLPPNISSFLVNGNATQEPGSSRQSPARSWLGQRTAGTTAPLTTFSALGDRATSARRPGRVPRRCGPGTLPPRRHERRPDESLPLQESHRLGDRCRADPQLPHQLGRNEAAGVDHVQAGEHTRRHLREACLRQHGGRLLERVGHRVRIASVRIREHRRRTRRAVLRPARRTEARCASPFAQFMQSSYGAHVLANVTKARYRVS
ncbi:hypothetical protein LX86_002982 [Lentzea aerocolonigenes]|nr:hypothetical protein [Lentzea aerocolonigenes]